MVDAVCAVQSVQSVRSGFEKTLVANMFKVSEKNNSNYCMSVCCKRAQTASRKKSDLKAIYKWRGVRTKVLIEYVGTFDYCSLDPPPLVVTDEWVDLHIGW